MDDATIIELIRTGKHDLALNALYRNFPAVRKVIRSRGGTTKDAEDIFQEALIILLRNLQKEFRLTAQLSTWLYAVCRNLWNDQVRKQKPQLSFDETVDLHRAATPDGENPLRSPDPNAIPDPTEPAGFEAALQRESRIRLAEQIIDNLKDRCRELLLLFYHDGLDLATIAERIGYSSANTAKNQKYKCLETARNELKTRLAEVNI